MKLFVITPIYATTTEGDGATPLVHYFAREWVKMGHEVTVFHFQSRFPRPFYWFSKMFQHQLNSRLGMLVPTLCPSDDDYVAEGVTVKKRTITKFKPHTEYTSSGIEYALSIIKKEIEITGRPDYFVGHWSSPCLDIMPKLKELYDRPIAIVFHSNEFHLEDRFGSDVIDTLKKIDVIGFRSKVAKKDFENKYFIPSKSFICYSGVSNAFLSAGEKSPKYYQSPINNFIYTGSLIKRKFASRLYKALTISFPDGNFSVKFVGNGTEQEVIEQLYNETKKGEVVFTGRIPREDIIAHLLQSDIFAMISEGEIFGLVYLEAMALGIIPIGSRNEGIDGIIVDGINGFLCEAGNTEELATIINKIKKMTPDELNYIANNALQTARMFSDENVAVQYIKALLQ